MCRKGPLMQRFFYQTPPAPAKPSAPVSAVRWADLASGSEENYACARMWLHVVAVYHWLMLQYNVYMRTFSIYTATACVSTSTTSYLLCQTWRGTLRTSLPFHQRKRSLRCQTRLCKPGREVSLSSLWSWCATASCCR